MSSRRQGVRRYVPYLRPYRNGLALMLATAFLAIGTGVAIPQLIKQIIDGPVAHRHAAALTLPVLVIVVLALVEAGTNFVRRNLAGLVSLGVEKDLRDDFYAQLQRLHVGFHDNWQSGQLLSRAISDIGAVRRFIGFGAVFALIFGVQFAAVMVMLFRLDPRLAAMTLVVTVPIAMISRSFFRKYAHIAREVQERTGDVTTVIEEMATGARIIRSFGRADQLFESYHVQVRLLRSATMESISSRATFWTLMTLFPNIALTLVVAAGGLAVINHQLSLGGLVAYVTYLFMLIWPMDALGWVLAMGDEAHTAALRLSEVFDSVPEVADNPGATDLVEPTGAIRFEGVGYSYGESRPVLQGLDLEIQPGETMALVGRTGSGKTTLAMLVPRLFDAHDGRVLVDGRDVRDVTLRSLRQVIGTAFEDPILFSASVRENLHMGRPRVSDDDIMNALAVAHAEFVLHLPAGLDTRIGEQGHTLSGGQRQRLALARAILARPRILVLDDPLSAVDVHTEGQIEAALRSVLQGVTAILVAHRPSTLLLADRVALLDGGRIVAVGTHQELLRNAPLYRQLISQDSGSGGRMGGEATHAAAVVAGPS
ncbi:MAG: ABC transporter ATP-binding protein [Candidatus Dormibacteria bacterium]